MADTNGKENIEREFAPQIRNALTKGNLVICAGAGVTLFGTADASGRIHQQSLTWLRLMRSGFNYIKEHLPSACNDSDNINRIQKARVTLDVPDRQYSEADEDSYLDTAETLADILKPYPTSLADWLTRQFQALHESVTHPEIHNILRRLHQAGAQLMTTTYDHLLEHHCGNPVFHPLGEWEHPSGIVLNSRAYYDAPADNNNIQAKNVLRDIFKGKTVLFVGCGPGTGDPNFGEMLRWLGSQNLNENEDDDVGPRHYMLLRHRDNYREVEGRLPLVKVRVETVDDIPRWLEGLLETGPR
ncbi:hypothetical protein B0T16DRAFT_395923 [Cercophora newfieldiana]|uniref:SIR2-like domain-containing protein n=1 Tax=Cercophora newfieldiana TaxID=92897 RepID=A0AA39YM53_9PEZI|nr:hypothetical protein B0T16DRAFT_395923 [Cercophora newfieldiana]